MLTDKESDRADCDVSPRFGRYQTTRLLGKGAMGMVYLAHDPVLDRKVALKVISVDSSLDKSAKNDYFKRFSYEAKASAKLNHPSIVTVYDAGEDNGLPWIAFQFVEGETLEKLLKRRGRLPIRRAIAFGLDIAGALKHAHGWNIVHRDVKPANILIENLTGVAKLADFGIVKAPWAPATQAGNTLGSPGYMSPEQIEGSDLDQRADLFCLGVVLYQMVCGKHPFLRDTMASTVFATCNGAFTPMGDLVDDVPPMLEWAVRSCLAADRKRRIGSATQLIAILRSVGQQQPVATSAASPVQSPAVSNNGSDAADIPVSAAIRLSTNLLFLRLKAGQALGNMTGSIIHRMHPWALGAGHAALKLSDVCGSIGKRFSPLRFAFTLPIKAYKNSPRLTWSCMAGLAGVAIALIVAWFLGSAPAGPSPGSPEALLMRQCVAGLDDNNRDMAMGAALKLSAMNPARASARLLIARALIRDGKFEAAANALASAARLKGSGRALHKELPAILDEIERQLKKDSAPPALLDLVVYTLSAGHNARIRSWTTDTNYWLRWNAVKILRLSDVDIDSVRVYVLDLAFAGSVQTRLQAVRMLGDLRDKRAETALRKVKELGQNDPLVSAEASRVLEEKYR